MKNNFLLISILFISVAAFSQNKMRSADELISDMEPSWSLIQLWMDSAKNKIEVLPCDSENARKAIYNTQITTRSALGAVIFKTGGLLIDNGWIRILGSGSIKLNRSLPDWNKGKSFNEFGEKPSFLLVADDAVGGFFAMNGGKFGEDTGGIYYLSPDKLKWEALDLTYTDFLNFCFKGDLKEFYGELRWKNWEKEVSKLDGNKVYNFYPYLWTKEGKNINKNKRKQIPVEEQFNFNIECRIKLGLDTNIIQSPHACISEKAIFFI